MNDPIMAQHVIGKLLKHFGPDHVLWGSESIWVGSPQPQIEAFRAFQISKEFQEKYGYPELTREIKAINACFAKCETSALVQAAGSKEGGCIAPYIAATSNPEAVTFLEQGTCGTGEVCAPCLDPTKDFKVSGACE